MTDKLSEARRSQNMAAIRSRNTKPELIVRRLVHSLGYRYRLHRKDLPGKPDLVFGPRQAVIFVHGCFWHMHPQAGCLDARKPKSNRSYWLPKLKKNIERDARNLEELRLLGWRVLIIWDCETRNTDQVTNRIAGFLGPVLRPHA